MIQTAISIISTVVSTLLLVVTIVQNVQLKKQYLDSKQPQLSMNIKRLNNLFYLSVKNVGGSEAKGVVLSPLKIENNGDDRTMLPDKLFNHPFDLYPGETVSGVIAIDVSTITFESFPYLHLSVKYEGNSGVKQKYERVVILDAGSDQHVRADVSLGRDIASDINKSMKAQLRIANYLDGMQVAPFDELNILANKSLHDDMVDVVNGKRENSTVTCRDKVIEQNKK